MSENSRSTVTWRFGVAFIILICAFLMQYYYPGTGRQMLNPTGSATAGQAAGREETVRLVTNYLKCGHAVVSEEAVSSPRMQELLTMEPDLQRQYREGTGVLLLTDEGFCPEDAEQRYLGIIGEYLAVFKGKVGQGELETITQIKVERLPAEWQRQLLDGKLVFKDEVSLLEALDSLDEYQS